MGKPAAQNLRRCPGSPGGRGRRETRGSLLVDQIHREPITATIAQRRCGANTFIRSALSRRDPGSHALERQHLARLRSGPRPSPSTRHAPGTSFAAAGSRRQLGRRSHTSDRQRLALDDLPQLFGRVQGLRMMTMTRSPAIVPRGSRLGAQGRHRPPIPIPALRLHLSTPSGAGRPRVLWVGLLSFALRSVPSGTWGRLRVLHILDAGGKRPALPARGRPPSCSATSARAEPMLRAGGGGPGGAGVVIAQRWERDREVGYFFPVSPPRPSPDII